MVYKSRMEVKADERSGILAKTGLALMEPVSRRGRDRTAAAVVKAAAAVGDMGGGAAGDGGGGGAAGDGGGVMGAGGV